MANWWFRHRKKPVPKGAAKGDYVTPTQPFSELSFRPTKDLSGADMWGATMFDQLVCRVMFHQMRYEGIFTPPSEQGTLVFPGNLGMFEWGGISVDQIVKWQLPTQWHCRLFRN